MDNDSKSAWKNSWILNDKNAIQALSCLIELKGRHDINTPLAIKVEKHIQLNDNKIMQSADHFYDVPLTSLDLKGAKASFVDSCRAMLRQHELLSLKRKEKEKTCGETPNDDCAMETPQTSTPGSESPSLFYFLASLTDKSESEEDSLSTSSSLLSATKNDIVINRDYFIFLLEHVNGRDISKYLTPAHYRYHHYTPDTSTLPSIPDPCSRMSRSVRPSKRQLDLLRDLYLQRQLEKQQNGADSDSFSPLQVPVQPSTTRVASLSADSMGGSTVSPIQPMRIDRTTSSLYPSPKELAEIFNQEPIPIPQKQTTMQTTAQTTQMNHKSTQTTHKTTQTTHKATHKATQTTHKATQTSQKSSQNAQKMAPIGVSSDIKEEKASVWSPSLDQTLLQLTQMNGKDWDYMAGSRVEALCRV